MEVITKYPIVVTDSAAQTDAAYHSTYSAAEGGTVSGGTMEVLTSYPIVYTGSDEQTKEEYEGTYSAAFGDFLSTPQGRARRRKRRSENRRTGNTFGDKVRNFAKSDLAKGLLGGVLGGGAGSGGESIDNTPYPIPDEPKGMSKGAKIGIAVGAVALLGLGAWLILRKKK